MIVALERGMKIERKRGKLQANEQRLDIEILYILNAERNETLARNLRLFDD